VNTILPSSQVEETKATVGKISSCLCERNAYLLLAGVVGSVAYGLDTPGSDIDVLGVFSSGNEEILGLHQGNETIHGIAPDFAVHELKKFLSLALKSNPTITELLWLPEELYAVMTSTGKALRSLAPELVSRSLAANAYGGYAISQLSKPNTKNELRVEKNARHAFRLMLQGFHLLETGEVQVRLTEAEREEAFRVGRLAISDPAKLASEAEKWIDRLNDAATSSCLPEEPDYHAANDFLVDFRLARAAATSSKGVNHDYR